MWGQLYNHMQKNKLMWFVIPHKKFTQNILVGMIDWGKRS